MASTCVFLLCLLCFGDLFGWSSSEMLKMEPIVKLRQGTVEGFKFMHVSNLLISLPQLFRYPDDSGRSANIFLGISYASEFIF